MNKITRISKLYILYISALIVGFYLPVCVRASDVALMPTFDGNPLPGPAGHLKIIDIANGTQKRRLR